jgi:heme-degrading monooxygenase HmoA
MVTTVSHVRLKEGVGPAWDEAMRERLEAARSTPGWVAGQVLEPVDGSNLRVIVGTWRSREDWERWHGDASFQAMRERLDEMEDGPHQQWWHEVTVAAER